MSVIQRSILLLLFIGFKVADVIVDAVTGVLL